MGSIIVSIIIFGVAIFLFWKTNRKINAIKSEIIQEELRDEMESLITEFNRTASRNIELIEDRIEELKRVMQKADNKIIQMEERIERAKKPIVVEKVVERKPLSSASKSKSSDKKEKPVNKQKSAENEVAHPFSQEDTPSPENHTQTYSDKAAFRTRENKPETTEEAPVPQPTPQQKEENPDNKLSRADLLKKLIGEGKTKEELVDMGFVENEINLLKFLISKN
jgi:hypothetical protein